MNAWMPNIDSIIHNNNYSTYSPHIALSNNTSTHQTFIN